MKACAASPPSPCWLCARRHPAHRRFHRPQPHLQSFRSRSRPASALPFPGNVIPPNLHRSHRAQVPGHVRAAAQSHRPSTTISIPRPTRITTTPARRASTTSSAIRAGCLAATPSTTSASAWPDSSLSCPPTSSLRAQQAAIGYTFSGASWLNEARLQFHAPESFRHARRAPFSTRRRGQLGLTGLSGNPANFGLPYLPGHEFFHRHRLPDRCPNCSATTCGSFPMASR